MREIKKLETCKFLGSKVFVYGGRFFNLTGEALPSLWGYSCKLQELF